jgi:succinate-acetate transporter protein
MVAAHMAHWFGGAKADLYLAPFAAMFGGLAQFASGMWSFKARDGLATAMHGMWGAFWIAFGLLQYEFMRGVLAEPTGAFPSLGYWFLVLAAITWVGFIAATAESVALSAVLGILALGATVSSIANLVGNGGLAVLAGYLFMLAAVCAFYLGSALMLEGSFKRPVLGVGKKHHAGGDPMMVVGEGEPGVIRGQ